MLEQERALCAANAETERTEGKDTTHLTSRTSPTRKPAYNKSGQEGSQHTSRTGTEPTNDERGTQTDAGSPSVHTVGATHYSDPRGPQVTNG